MNIVYLTSEAVPFAKTGGLADVCGTLPARVAELGHSAAIIMPAFRSVRSAGLKVETTDISFAIEMAGGRRVVGARLLRGSLPRGDVPVWFIDQPQYFDREGLYGDTNGDYPDNAERFAFFCRAALTALARIGLDVDVVHCNDWQSGLVPGLIKAAPETYDCARDAATIMTIHNMAYQGQFPADAFVNTGLDWDHFRHQSFEFYDHLNFLKAGLATADAITTVSPRYSQEIQTPDHGCGLDGVLRAAGGHVTGITNGIDRSVWDPSSDQKIQHRYDVNDWRGGKVANKQSLQERFEIEVSGDLPMIGLVGRLAEQKGWDLILPVLHQHMQEGRPTQWVVLGSGDGRVESELSALAQRYPARLGLHLGFDDALAHQIEAAADIFLMPSHYEPCGLNQLYSLRYGTVPIVTETGGLADTVVDCTEQTLSDQTATGFYLHEFSPAGLDAAIGRALHLRHNEPKKWEEIVVRGMEQDWSWRRSAAQYVELYERTISLKQSD